MNNICYIADTKKSKAIYFSLRSGSEHKREEINVSPFIMASRSGGTWGQKTSASFSTHPRFISLLIQFITLGRVAWQHPEVSTHTGYSSLPLQSAPSLFGWQITSFTWLTVNLKNVMCVWLFWYCYMDIFKQVARLLCSFWRHWLLFRVHLLCLLQSGKKLTWVFSW